MPMLNLLLLALPPMFYGQEPVAWWRFEQGGAGIGDDSSPGGPNPLISEPFSPGAAPNFTRASANACVGDYLLVDGSEVSTNLSASTKGPLPSQAGPGMTIELLFRVFSNASFNKAGNTTILRGGDGEGGTGWALAFGRHSVGFRAAGRVAEAHLIGSGVRSIVHLADGSWHHLAARIHGSTGEQSIWIDGQCPDMHPPTCLPPCTLGGSSPANASTAPGKIPAGTGVVTLLPTAFDGALDEIAIYASALSNATIWSHFHSTTVKHRQYSFTPATAPAPPPVPAGGQLNISDFPPGTVLPTPEGKSSAAGSNLTLPLDQLKAFPAPRYLKKVATGPEIGVPQRNFNWMDSSYMAGSPFKNFGKQKEWYEPQIQEELAKTFFYNINVQVMGRGFEYKPSDMDSLLFGLLDANPDWGADSIFQRMGARYCEVYGANATSSTGCEKGWRYTNQTLPLGCYLQDESGHFLTLTGAKATLNPKTGKIPRVLRPTTASRADSNRCPDHLFSDEWRQYSTKGAYKAAGLTRPVDRINNDGEYNVIYEAAANTFDPVTELCAYDKDPTLLVDYTSSGIPHLPNGRPNWYAFVSQWRARFATQLYTALATDSDSPEFKGTQWTEYQIQGTNLFMGEWNYTRKINTPRRNGGKLRYYATGDLYPWIQKGKHVKLGPYNNISTSLEYGTPSWDVSHGSWHSIDWLQQILPSQIATGDNVWSPFVAAGWSEQEELNTRPAQWLGFLKLLVVSGAEYFYSGFFSLHPPFPDSRNWIWQAAAPSLAQAVNSNFLDVLYLGELLHGDMPVTMGMCAVIEPMSDPMQWVWKTGRQHCELNTSRYQPYRFWTGSQSVAVLVRRLGDIYIIGGTIQPQSNFNDAPFSETVQITLPNVTDSSSPGTAVRFSVRRQGSVFLLNLTKATKKPTIRLLDSWHESTHFLRWSPHFALEAELHDSHSLDGSNIHSHLSPQALHAHDFVDAVTFVRLAEGHALNFTVSPRPVRIGIDGTAHETSSRRYRLRIKARTAILRSVTVLSRVTGMGGQMQRVQHDSARWAWKAASSDQQDFVLPTDRDSTLCLTADSAMDIDSIQLVEQ